MRLLVVTQKVDRTDPILGFFCSWLHEFSKHYSNVTVITQQYSLCPLPKNVQVLSLQKDRGASSFMQAILFWKDIFVHRNAYDCVFVHMTPIWVILGSPIWILFRKRIFLWYEIKRGSMKLSLALRFVCNVFAASEHGLPTVNKKQITVGHGIDTDLFRPEPSRREPHHLVAVGRLTSIKHYEVILRALSALPPQCRLTIAGGTVTKHDTDTAANIDSLIHRLSLADRVTIGWVSPQEMPSLLQRADCMLHASQGGLDKVVLQAMACGCPVVSTSTAAHSVLPEECCATQENLAEKVQAILALSDDARKRLRMQLRTVVEQDHSLSQCIQRIVSYM